MLIPVFRKQYKKSLNLCKKRNYDFEKLKEVIEKLSNNIPLSRKNKNHQL